MVQHFFQELQLGKDQIGRLDKEKGLRVIWCEDNATTTSDGQPPGDHLSEVVLHHQLLWNALTLLLYFKAAAFIGALLRTKRFRVVPERYSA